MTYDVSFFDFWSFLMYEPKGSERQLQTASKASLFQPTVQEHKMVAINIVYSKEVSIYEGGVKPGDGCCLNVAFLFSLNSSVGLSGCSTPQPPKCVLLLFPKIFCHTQQARFCALAVRECQGKGYAC